MGGLSRRRVLKGVGGVAVALPFLDRFRSPASTQVPRRYVQLSSPLGMSPGLWYTPSGTNGFEITDWAAPFREHAENLLIVRGMKGWNGASGHHTSVGTTFTGGEEGSGYGISLDQQIAQLIDHGTFPSLNLGFFTVTDTDRPGETITTYSGADSQIYPVKNPATTFTTLFGGGSPEGSEALMLAQQRRRSVLDLVRDDYRDARSGLSSSDRIRLEDHAEYIRAVEVDLGDMGAMCGGGDPSAYRVSEDATAGAELSRAQSRLIALALACDLTRVASLQWSHAINGLRYHWLESRQEGIASKSHHGWTHHPSTGDWSQGLRFYREIERWYLEEVAFLVSELKRLDVFEGTTVLWCTNEARGPHGPDEDGRSDLTYALFSSPDGPFNTGQVVDVQVDGYQPPESRHDYPPCLLFAVAQAYGYTADSFGSAYRCQGGPTPGVRS